MVRFMAKGAPVAPLAVACGGDGKARAFEFWKSPPGRSTRRRLRPSCDRLEERAHDGHRGL